MSSPATTVSMSPELAKRQTAPTDPQKEKLDDASEAERKEVHEIMAARQRYSEDRKQKENEWTQSFKMYMSWLDTVLNPYLSNLFIPKTHEAVELLAAFLIGTNQSVTASAENGATSTEKATVAGKYLDFLWRKVLKARIKILVWIKQGIVFGNGIMKVGWDADAENPWMTVCAIEDVYFDFYIPDIQDSEYIIHEIRRDKADVMDDEKYDMRSAAAEGGGEGELIRSQVIVGGPTASFGTSALFSTYDRSLKQASCTDKVLVVEVWCLKENKIKTLLPTTLGWRIARDAENPNYYKVKTEDNGEPKHQPFRPFVKMRFKVSPLPNRAYDTGAVFPTVKIQQSFNALVNEYFDNVVLVNNKMWIKRRGARINPAELVRRPGGVITVSDIQKDLKSEETSDVKQSIIEMLNRLDSEFQQASMVVNLLKGTSESDTATGDALAQQNVQTLLEMIDQNIVDALSELGQMVLAIALENKSGIQSVKLFENDKETVMIAFDPADIDGMHDIRIVPDRNTSTSKAVQNKQLLDLINLIQRDPTTRAKYPDIMEKVYKRWLENGGVGDPDFFFTDPVQPTALPTDPNAQKVDPAAPQLRLPAAREQLTPGAIEKSANAPTVVS